MSVHSQASSSFFYIFNNFSQKRIKEINKSSKKINIGLFIISTIAIIGTTYSLNKEYFGAVLNTTSHLDMTIKILTISSLFLVILGCVALTLLKNKQFKEQENLNEKNIIKLKNKINDYKQNTQKYLIEIGALEEGYKEKLSQVRGEYLNKISDLENEIDKCKENEKDFLENIKVLQKKYTKELSQIKIQKQENTNKKEVSNLEMERLQKEYNEKVYEYWSEIVSFKSKINICKQNEQAYLIEIEALEEGHNEKFSQVKGEYLNKISDLKNKINICKQNEQAYLIEIENLQKENNQVKLKFFW